MTEKPAPSSAGRAAGQDFIRTIVADDLAAGRHATVITRFPPEPNGFLHIGHAKSITLNFGLAGEVPGARCHLRFDDTNPETEDVRYVESIQADVRWLGYDWGTHLYFASDYFDRMYACAESLVRRGLAYVDSQSDEEIRARRGTVTTPGTPSPFRDRSVDENLDLLRRMRAGEFPDGAHVLRARIDMGARNMLMRDPLLYRIRHAHHFRTGGDWPIYPLYDYAHPLEDAIEHVTHSLCTLEFENNRELYDWLIANVELPGRPRQIEFARLALDYTVLSKRRLLRLVSEGDVDGWDDPRMPTIAGLRRRGVTPEAIRTFCEMVGVARSDSRVDIGKLEYAIRDDLNARAPRVMCVLDPLPVTITNWPDDVVETIDAPYWPHDVPNEGSRGVPFARELLIERDDFMEDPPKGFHRLVPGGEVRLRYGYIVRCDEVVRDDAGRVTALRCSYDAATRGGAAGDRKVRGTIHWVAAGTAVPCEVRLYDRLFDVPDPDAAASEGGVEFRAFLNPDSLVRRPGARIEPAAAALPAGTHLQFERLGYFITDAVDSRADALVFNRTVTLRDTWSRRVRAPQAGAEAAAPRGSGAQTAAPSRPAGGTEARSAPVSPARAADAPDDPDVAARRAVLEARAGVSAADAALLARDAATAAIFEAALAALPADTAHARTLANWTIHELPRAAGDRPVDQLALDPTQFARLVVLLEQNELSSTGAREVLAELAQGGAETDAIVAARGLRQVSDDAALAPIVAALLAENPDKAAAYRGGRRGLLGFFMGQAMARSGGRANPERLRALLEDALAREP